MKQKLFIDLDDCVFNTIKCYCQCYNDIFKYNVNFKRADWKQVKEWNYTDECPLNIGYENDIFGDRLFFKNAEPFLNAINILDRLNEEFDLIVVSIGVPENIAYKAIWVKENLPFIKNAIYLYKGKENDTGKSIIDMSGGIFIDDHQNNLFTSNADWKICYTNEYREYKWNKDWKGTKVGNWNEVKKLLL